MNKGQFVEAIVAKTGLAKKDASKALDAVLDVVTETLTEGEKISLTGFGTFEVKHRAERKARNIKTGEEILVPAKNVPAFKPGKSLKDALK